MYTSFGYKYMSTATWLWYRQAMDGEELLEQRDGVLITFTT